MSLDSLCDFIKEIADQNRVTVETQAFLMCPDAAREQNVGGLFRNITVDEDSLDDPETLLNGKRRNARAVFTANDQYTHLFDESHVDFVKRTGRKSEPIMMGCYVEPNITGTIDYERQIVFLQKGLEPVIDCGSMDLIQDLERTLSEEHAGPHSWAVVCEGADDATIRPRPDHTNAGHRLHDDLADPCGRADHRGSLVIAHRRACRD